MKRTTLKHFPIRTETTDTQPPHYFALCTYDSDKPNEFVNPQHYKPENVLECCRQYDKLETK